MLILILAYPPNLAERLECACLSTAFERTEMLIGLRAHRAHESGAEAAALQTLRAIGEHKVIRAAAIFHTRSEARAQTMSVFEPPGSPVALVPEEPLTIARSFNCGSGGQAESVPTGRLKFTHSKPLKNWDTPL